MDKTIDWINTIINELVDPKAKLKDTLLKVQVLSFKIKNDKLKAWVDSELNGFMGKEVPSYRKIPSAIFGNLIQDRGFGGALTRKNTALPIEYIKNKVVRETLLGGFSLNSSVSELELMLEKGGDYFITIPHAIHQEITEIIQNGWVVDSAWQRVPLASIEGILGSIKSTLLTFLLELADEIGEKDNINIMKEKNKIDKLFDKTIGNLTGETINISIGTDNVQSVNTGKNAKVNVAKGKKIKQTIKGDKIAELEKFTTDLKLILDKLSLSTDDSQDIKNELARIDSQIERETPKYTIINEALHVINGILIGVAGNALTTPILEKLGLVITLFTGQ